MAEAGQKSNPKVVYLDEVRGAPAEFDRNSMLGHMGSEDEASMPLFWFNNLGQFWFWFIVSSSCLPFHPTGNT